jgi:hypothetical protein
LPAHLETDPLIPAGDDGNPRNSNRSEPHIYILVKRIVKSKF